MNVLRADAILEKLATTKRKERRLLRLEREATSGVGRITSKIPFTKSHRQKKYVEHSRKAARHGAWAKETGGLYKRLFNRTGRTVLPFDRSEMEFAKHQGRLSKSRANLWSKGKIPDILKAVSADYAHQAKNSDFVRGTEKLYRRFATFVATKGKSRGK